LKKCQVSKVLNDASLSLFVGDVDYAMQCTQVVWDQHLSKAFTLESFKVDWDFKWKGETIERPNHGLCHTLRTVAYAPLVAKSFIEHCSDQSIIDDIWQNLPWIQIALLFYVAGRENEMGSRQDHKEYMCFRESSAALFASYVMEDGPCPASIRLQCIDALKRRDGPVHWVKSIMTICHDLDLMRCVSSNVYDRDVCGAMYGVLGYEDVIMLKKVVAECLQATGDRTTINGPYQGDVFVQMSVSIDLCANTLLQVVKKYC